MEKKDEYGDSWHMMRQNLLFIYKEALSSNCGDLVQMIQVVLIFIKAGLGVYSHLKGGFTCKKQLYFGTDC